VDPVAAHGTPLHGAAGEGQYGAVKILLDHNADYNKMVNGVTPLMAARDANSTECIKLLVKVQEEPMLKREIVASELISLGSISLKKKDYAVAAKLYSRAMQLDPDDAVLFSDRSLCWLHMGDGRKALLDANKCRKMRPHWPKACRRQGEALMLLKDYEGASERFLDGLKLDPVDTDIEDALRISECH
uniref:Uncharacterized protein n=1 Tax=Aegilops tauschii subsp. strangulata TaxID=200361 RepID=A0A452XPX0_AEGTS